MDSISALSDALSAAPWVAVPAALAWGLASIWLSPCHLAGVPLVVGWLSAAPEAQVRHGRTLVVTAFALGIVLSLLPLGALALALGRVAGDVGLASSYLVAGICVLAGLYLLDWLPAPWTGRGLPRPASRGPWTALLLGALFGLALGPCAFAWIAPVLGVAWLQAADGLALPGLLLLLFAVGHCAGVLLAAASLGLVQRWLDALGRHRGLALGRAACGTLLLVAAGLLIGGA